MKTKSATTPIKSKSLSEIEEKYFGKKGTAKRNKYEEQVEVQLVGELLRQYRQENHLTQNQLANKTGIDKTYISKIENNVKTQRIDTLVSVLKALHGQLFIKIPFEKGFKEVELV